MCHYMYNVILSNDACDARVLSPGVQVRVRLAISSFVLQLYWLEMTPGSIPRDNITIGEYFSPFWVPISSQRLDSSGLSRDCTFRDCTPELIPTIFRLPVYFCRV